MTKFIYLPNDCLRQLFETMPWNELCGLQSVSGDYRVIADRVFIDKYADHIEIDDLMKNILNDEQIVTCFGGLIKKLTVTGCFFHELNTSILEKISEYCSNNLKELRLVCFNFDKVAFTHLTKIFDKLESFQLHFSELTVPQSYIDFQKLLSVGKNIKELSIISNHCCNQTINGKFLNRKLPSLEKVEIIAARLQDEKTLGLFFKKNSQIKRFIYMPCSPPVTSSKSWLDQMTNFATNLKDLSVRLMPNDNSFEVKKLTKLNRIEINCMESEKTLLSIVKQLAVTNTVEVLSLWSVTITAELLAELEKMIKLQTLELRELKSKYDVKELVPALRKMKYLSELRLDYTTINCFGDVRQIYENCKSIKRLMLCDLRCSEKLPGKSETTPWLKRRRDLNMMPGSVLTIFVNAFYLGYLPQEALHFNGIQFKPFTSKLDEVLSALHTK